VRRKSRVRNPLFAKRWFRDDVIVLCVRWYLRFPVSYREMAEIAWELGVVVAPSTILRLGGPIRNGIRTVLAILRAASRPKLAN
jgi:transposase-like protein